MLADEARTADTAAWLAKAQLDLRSARHALLARPPIREDNASDGPRRTVTD